MVWQKVGLPGLLIMNQNKSAGQGNLEANIRHLSALTREEFYLHRNITTLSFC